MSPFSGDDTQNPHPISVCRPSRKDCSESRARKLSDFEVFPRGTAERLHKNSCLFSMPLLRDANTWNDVPSMKTSTSQLLPSPSSSTSSPSSLSSSSASSPRTFFTNGLSRENLMRESKDGGCSKFSYSGEAAYHATLQQHLDISKCTPPCLLSPSPFCFSPSFTKHHPDLVDLELASNYRSSSITTREQHLQDGCNQRITGSSWSRLLVLTISLLAMASCGVQSLPLGGQSETEQAYRKLQESTVVSHCSYLTRYTY
ncbi:hypothetical protein ElyMa_001852500 [Elysia marginata]|uniref:Uncharacterized protein n=1 Tax=Elysia marginata TaxID=1093978 RepID=A0AAV4EKS1_9GAST|nr:hypothetical protein ElyMa_001852500 [Elysia marginata]